MKVINKFETEIPVIRYDQPLPNYRPNTEPKLQPVPIEFGRYTEQYEGPR